MARHATLTLLGTIAHAQDVTYDFDKAADFSKVRTYAWVTGTTVNDELTHKRIVNAVDAQLASKGLARVDANASPDVLVAYHASFDRDLQINAYSTGWGPFGLGGNRSGSARAQEILVGTLVVDITDASTRTIVWRAVARTDINPRVSPEKKDRNINKAAEKMFKNYPSRAER